MYLPHDSFCRGVLSDVPTFLELVRFLNSIDAELNDIFNLLDQDSFRRLPSDFSNTETTGYADLAFLADVKREFLGHDSQSIQVCVGFLVEHKSSRDDQVLEQLRRYNFHLMVQQLKENVYKGIPSIAIIIYNGQENWDPLKKLYAHSPKELQRLVLPFKCIMLDVGNVPDEQLNGFNARLAAFISALKYARNPEEHRDGFRKILNRMQKEMPDMEGLDLIHQMDVYLHGWIKDNFEGAFKMDFVHPNYRTVGDAIYEDGEKAGEKNRAEETARKMLAQDEPMEKIIAYSGLSEAQVKALAAQMH